MELICYNSYVTHKQYNEGGERYSVLIMKISFFSCFTFKYDEVCLIQGHVLLKNTVFLEII
jgi:hypothetical protein